MAHLTCRRHNRRVHVELGLTMARHRSDGSPCKGIELKHGHVADWFTPLELVEAGSIPVLLAELITSS